MKNIDFYENKKNRTLFFCSPKQKAMLFREQSIASSRAKQCFFQEKALLDES